MKKIKPVVLIIGLCFLLTSCTSITLVSSSPVISATMTNIETLTVTNLQISTSTHTPPTTNTPRPTHTPPPTNTHIPTIGIGSLQPGDYLVQLEESADPDLYYPVIFSDGIQVGRLSPIVFGVISPDLKYVENLPNIVDRSNGATLNFSGFDYCGRASCGRETASM